MMKTFKIDKQMLSAYIDGELSSADKIYIEGRISSSLELQKELADLKRLKELTSTSYERLAEAPFFQTRLSAELNSSKPGLLKSKKWIPVFSLLIITAALMITLKVNPDLIKNVIEDQKVNLANLYKENLQPLLYAADLTNEDIFNFAFNSEIPLDKTDQHFLRLGYDSSGAEYFEIKKSINTNKENNLEKFVQALDLNEIQRKEIDSIIASYSDELMTQVLVSDKNTVAINPDLWNYQKAIASEILAFARSKNASVYNSILPVELKALDNPQISKLVRYNKPPKDHKYIFFTPDTIFTDTFEFDNSEFRKDMKEMEKDLAEMNKNIVKMNYQISVDTTFKRLKKDSSWTKDFSVHFDSENFKVILPDVIFRKLDIQMPNMDSINIIIEEALKQVQVFSEKNNGKHKSKFKVEVHSSDSSNFDGFEFNYPKMDSMMMQRFLNLDSLKKFNFEQFDLFGDSSSQGFNFFFNDSMFFNQNEELRKQMNELKQEMRRFREEMRNFQLDPPENPDTVKPKIKGIDI